MNINNFLFNVVKNVQTHNRILEENQMWNQKVKKEITSEEVQNELEKEINYLDESNAKLLEQIEDYQQKIKNNKLQNDDYINKLEKELERYKKDINESQEKCIYLQKKTIELENENDILTQQNRNFESIVNDLEVKIDLYLEELAMVQTELERKLRLQ
ncbi:hypothetical protein IMG5_202630 [Ichthyophthirius multifiliis]|uniref:Uncharacterized protein n=1 Tax=Ichthyophthirius multifiliis TaxID=5932 RepID=G0R661_ICHMU|nr:hypothetical protein IMG5_202630 [Ichthyophthirius multifiliis]EGR27025.1 hypothetical protein IMG5_202630 [Ichthyophthirius multifiliis]|eukprot:XP_004023909.1 hypothetical protein IMG5_202630 [Ichthyophthirius multifiliis]